MSRVCVIGNSHISALVLGWREIARDHAQTTLEFFAAPGTKVNRFKVSRGSLVPRSATLRKFLAVTSQQKTISGDYDIYLICGLRLGVLHMAPLFGRFRPEALTPDERAPLSNECFARSLIGCVSASLAVETVRKLREITSAPIAVIPDPLPTKNYAECDFLNRAEERGEAETVASFFEAACVAVCAGLNAECHFQPSSTKSAILRTDVTYSEGAMRLRTGSAVEHRNPLSIARHMNGTYGALVLREILGTSASRSNSE
ncbi:MAG TPA: hypothetical protein VHT03_00400 [Rhizomicrobium sp.]|jgi:hypothetical protein|nr:hypothetical protein [Rhizomicrobium sp.]